MKYLIFLTLILVLTGISACKNDDAASLNNIEDLYAQPLPVIQKCVLGKWKWIAYSTYGYIGLWYPSNTFINITNDSVVVTGGDGLNRTFSYSWDKRETLAKLANYTTYVMWNNEQNTGEWFFDKIRNDSLFVLCYKVNPDGYNDSYLFLRIK